MKNTKHVSKFLSYTLRHHPEDIGITLDPNGWANVEELITKAPEKFALNRALLDEVVATNDKKRFAFSEDGTCIRASQGHSATVDLNIAPTEPPETLFHGTATRFLDSILRDGLNPGSRQHVHLSPDALTARKVGERHGKPVILTLPARDMHKAGHVFYCSANGVWLTDKVAASALSKLE
ncbi:UNVERIFIED_CONTAM: hypothetical protein GTU68_035451 [Idotea baltica]|nr:hypothetical protein [Idotea baltica]